MNHGKHEQRKQRRREQLDRVERIARYYAKIEMLRAMVAEYENLDDDDGRAERRRLKARIRTVEQQIRYTSGAPQQYFLSNEFPIEHAPAAPKNS
jgi:hypothetical protein